MIASLRGNNFTDAGSEQKTHFLSIFPAVSQQTAKKPVAWIKINKKAGRDIEKSFNESMPKLSPVKGISPLT